MIIKKRGFTLVELIIVIGVIGMLIPAVFALFFIDLRAQSKALIMQDVKRNGDNALSAMTSLIKQNAVSLHSDYPPDSSNEVCATGSATFSGSPIYFEDVNNDWFAFYLDENRIASESSSTGVGYLTSSTVYVDNAGDGAFTLTCVRGSTYNPPLVSISYRISQASQSATRQEEKAEFNYQTKVKLRSY